MISVYTRRNSTVRDMKTLAAALALGLVLAVSVPTLAGDQAKTTPVPPSVVKYGFNAAVGRTFTHDGVKLYYEVYGTGEPLLLVHGNGSSIGELKAQIDHFRKRYRVIAMDSRDHGKSGDSPDEITYE